MPDKSAWEGRSRGTQSGYRIFVWLLRTGGLRPAYSLLHFVTLYYRWFVPAATQPLRYLYEKRLGFSRYHTAHLIKRNIILFGQTLIDKIAILSGVKVDLEFTHEGIENIEQLVKEGKGGILLSAHLGNWEVAGHLLNRVEAPINIVMYDGEEQQMKQYMDQFERKPFNAPMKPTGAGCPLCCALNPVPAAAVCAMFSTSPLSVKRLFSTNR